MPSGSVAGSEGKIMKRGGDSLTVRLKGPTDELLLLLLGRGEVAEVEVTGLLQGHRSCAADAIRNVPRSTGAGRGCLMTLGR
jgi:hypothetical protein